MSNNNFVKDNLLPNEQIIANAQWHWMKKWWLTIVLLIITLITLIITIIDWAESYHWETWYWDWSTMDADTGNTYFIASTILSILSYFLSKWVMGKYDEFAITNLRVIAKVGLISRRSFDLHIEQIESIEVRQGILGRLMGFGTLIPGGVGASKVRIAFVKDPFEFRQHFYDLKKGQQKTIE